MFKFLNGESKTVISGAAIVAFLSFASRLVGLMRDRFLAGHFGAGDTLDAYYAAFKLPDLFFNLIVVGALSASFIPLFTKYFFDEKKRARAWEVTNNVLHIILCGLIVLFAVLAVAADPLSKVIAPGFSPEKLVLVASYTRVMLLAQIMLAASMIFGSALQGMRRFFLSSLAPIFYNVGIIVGAMWFTESLGPIGLAWGVVLGAFLHLLIQLVGVRSAGYRHAWVFRPRDPDSREILRLMGPRVVGIGTAQINFVIFTIIASTLTAGSVTLFQFAYNIQYFPVGIIGISYAIAAFPSFAETLGKGDKKGFLSVFTSTIRQLVFFLAPLTVLFILLRAQLVRVIVGAGDFDWAATVTTANTLAFFALSFIAQAFVALLSRAFYALRDTATPLVLAVVTDIIALICALWLKSSLGVMGLGIAFSLSAIVEAALLWVTLRQRAGGTLGERALLKPFAIIGLASVCAGIVMQTVKPLVVSRISLDTFFGVLSQGVVSGGIGLAVYVLVSAALGSPELGALGASLRRKLLSKATPTEAVTADAPPSA